jgi:hypothetical protein
VLTQSLNREELASFEAMAAAFEATSETEAAMSGGGGMSPPHPPLPVHMTFHKERRTVHALWMNAPEVVSREDNSPWFMVCADSSHTPAVPTLVVKGLKLTELTGMVNGGNWRRFIKLTADYESPAGRTYPAGTALLQVSALAPSHGGLHQVRNCSVRIQGRPWSPTACFASCITQS